MVFGILESRSTLPLTIQNLRGITFEIERLEDKSYSENNCILACYGIIMPNQMFSLRINLKQSG